MGRACWLTSDGRAQGGSPHWLLVDPLCTFIFAIIVIMTTYQIMRDISDILMERVPRGLDADVIQADLQRVVHPSHGQHLASLYKRDYKGDVEILKMSSFMAVDLYLIVSTYLHDKNSSEEATGTGPFVYKLRSYLLLAVRAQPGTHHPCLEWVTSGPCEGNITFHRR